MDSASSDDYAKMTVTSELHDLLESGSQRFLVTLWAEIGWVHTVAVGTVGKQTIHHQVRDVSDIKVSSMKREEKVFNMGV